MSEISASNIGCSSCGKGTNSCSILWIIILLSVLGKNGGCGCDGGCDSGCGFGSNFLNGIGNNGCSEIIIILLLLSCCNNGCGSIF